jgi:hypothetical protein
MPTQGRPAEPYLQVTTETNRQAAGVATAPVRCVLLSRLSALGAHADAIAVGAQLRDDGIFERSDRRESELERRQVEEATAALVASLCAVERQVGFNSCWDTKKLPTSIHLSQTILSVNQPNRNQPQPPTTRVTPSSFTASW